jgi:Ca2+-binding RTX toxin-like protein
MKRFLSNLFATKAARPIRNERRHAFRPRLEGMEDRMVPTVGLVNGQVQLRDDLGGQTNNFKVDVDFQRSELVITDRAVESRFALSAVSDIKAIFNNDANEWINIERNAGKAVTVVVEPGRQVYIDLCKGSMFLDNISGHIAIVGSQTGTFQLMLNDQRDPFGDTYTLTNHSIGRPFSATVDYSAAGLRGLALYSGAAASTFNVESIVGGSFYNVIDAGTGSDTVNVGSPGTLDGVKGALKVMSGGAASLVFNDSAATTGKTFTIYDDGDGDNSVVLGSGPVSDAVVAYENVGSINIRAGSGNDSVVVDYRRRAMSALVSFLGGAGFDSLVASDLSNFWNITGRDAGRLTVSASSAGPLLATASFASVESLTGGEADDKFLFADGAGLTGSIDARGGTDLLDYSGYTTGVRVDLAAGSATGVFGAVGIENAFGGRGDDRIWGTDGNNLLAGGLGGNDVLVGRGGADSLFGGDGHDLLIGGIGADGLYGETGDDIVIDGTTLHDEDPATLEAIMAVWTRTDMNYFQRVSSLYTYLHDSIRLKNFLTIAGTMFHDGAVDTLSGGDGDNWVFKESIDVAG